MKKVEYSQLVKRKLLKLKKELTGEYGEEKAKEILTAMADHVDMLGQHDESGVNISRMYDIDTDYLRIIIILYTGLKQGKWSLSRCLTNAKIL